MNNSLDNVLINHMGESFFRLSPLLQFTHTGNKCLKGTSRVEHGNQVAKWICSFFQFPKENPEANLQVICQHSENCMHWKRTFDGKLMQSHFSRQQDYMVEKLGNLTLYFIAEERDGSLHYQFQKTHFLGVRLPSFFSPKIEAKEMEENGKYRYQVKVFLPIIGLVIAYGGLLEVSEITD